MKKISIIIPCYNVTSTIDHCMHALTTQTIGIDALEIILVNDASTDDTMGKLCEWEEKYPDSILVINCTENGGPGQARNIGIQYASAPFIGFSDDDDICEPDMFETLYLAATEHDCDLVICQSVRQELEYCAIDRENVSETDEILSLSNSIERLSFLDRDTNFAVWNKLYSKKMLTENDITFPVNTYYEDILFSSLVKRYCHKVYISKQVLYHHIVRPTSISNNASLEKRLQFMMVQILLIEDLRARNLYQTYYEWYDAQFIIQYFSFMISSEELFGEINPEIFALLKESILLLFPDFRSIPLVSSLANDESRPQLRGYIQRLVG